MGKTLKQFSEIVHNFATQRGWRNDDPNQLITSLIIEIGELSENYQWKSTFKKLSDDEKQQIGFEFVDVLFYLLQLANKSEINIEKYFDMKIKRLEEKFPLGQTTEDYKKVRKVYRKTGKNKLYE